MTGDVLFALGPLAALIACVSIATTIAWRGWCPHAAPPRRWSAVRRVVAAAAAIVAAQHALLLAAPGTVLRWNADPRRLLVLEAIGAIAGGVWAAERLIAWARQLANPTAGTTPIGRTLHLSITGVAAASGIAIAFADRWASSWSAVTLAPYIASLPSATPRVELVTSTPFAVRLHLVAAFACIAVLPFAESWAAVSAFARRLLGAFAVPASRAAAVIRPPFEATRLAALRLPAFWSEEDR